MKVNILLAAWQMPVLNLNCIKNFYCSVENKSNFTAHLDNAIKIT